MRPEDPSELFVYDVEVEERFRRRGVGKTLFRELEKIAREQGIQSGWMLKDRTNDVAMALYRAAGGRHPHEETMWEFDYGAS
jgi:ribosomal protein S18 acetylase RimI-like enzyme